MQQPFTVASGADPSPPTVAVTADDIWLSNYSPEHGEEVEIQIRVHNVSKTPATHVGVQIYARDRETNEREPIASVVIPRIGTEVEWIEEDEVETELYKVVDGTKYPMSRSGNTSIVLFTRALVDAVWTPQQAGYVQLEVELEPSDAYLFREGQGSAARIVPVGP
jgi:hypothetical protein